MTEPRSYHGQPVLKEPVWTWEIPLYFYTGGMAGSSAGLAYLAGLRGNNQLARRAWALAMAGIGLSPAFLISDLGRPARVMNMLRMFKPTSPMSVGSWILAVSGGATTLAAANAWTGRFARSAELARPAAALFGLPLSTYTAALVSNTAVPVWHESRRMLPFVFGSGAALSAGAGAVAITPREHAAPARRVALVAAAFELVSKELMERRLEGHGEPYKQGQASRFGQLGRSLITAGAALLAAKGQSSRPAAITAGGLLSAGALSARWSVFRAGFQGAADPRYVVAPQRERVDRQQTAGGARSSSAVQGPERQLATPATSLPAQ